ncbi:hypothetical protein CD127_11110 [Staphylococcus petrasii]|uniref:RicAFT regulatory complex protein RicA family protein n=1 Tax=Staphylococcus petrasii TaxID=1276936 RepID=UPI000CD214F2|nr:YlbF family regulator [Staphylococcus petrasii]PNZ80140.1 hypothetical protein CD127_11110 [Staphylococcus petrasii]TGA82631.1 hypothetical protein E2554_03505 [Staphylococcus petrasii]SUM60183.1 membrane protein [Staphylococcus petrasii]
MYSKEEILKQAEQLSDKISDLDIIKNYQNIEQQIHENATIKTKMNQLKKQQKQSVNFQNYGKTYAYEQSEGEIHNLENEINKLPIVEEFRSAQYEANDFLQMMISTMEKRLNDYNKKEHNDL